MRSFIRHGGMVWVLCALQAAAVHGQRRPDEPQRPNLPAAADTNDAAAYHSWGMTRLARYPKEAADAFYWAMRIDPTRAESFYARRVALLMSNPRTLVRYMTGDRSTLRSREVQAADSLYRHSLMLKPFIYRDLDRQMIDGYVSELSRQLQIENSSLTQGEIENYLDRALMQSGPSMRGWLSYSNGALPVALGLWNDALKQARAKAPIHADLAHIHYLNGSYIDAAAHMRAALDELEKNERDNEVFVYYSKEFYELGLGMSLEASAQFDEARAAYSRALQEDLSYFPAHRRLASIELFHGDTAAALASYALGAAIDGADASLRSEYGVLLLTTGDAASAVVEMQKLTTDEPWFASGWLLLGGALDMSGQGAEAAAAYSRFLELARRDHPDRDGVSARVTALRAGGSPP